MNTALKLALSLGLLSVSSSALAADKIGFFLVGGQYETDISDTASVRFGVGLPLLGLFTGGSVVAVSGDVAYLNHLSPATVGAWQPYVGGGLGLLGVIGTSGSNSATVFSVVPQVIGGGNYAFNDTWTAFAELSAGANVIFGNTMSGTTIVPNVGGRLGINYTLR